MEEYAHAYTKNAHVDELQNSRQKKFHASNKSRLLKCAHTDEMLLYRGLT